MHACIYILVVGTSSANNMMGKKKSTLTTLYRQFWLVSRDLECTLNPKLDIKERNTMQRWKSVSLYTRYLLYIWWSDSQCGWTHVKDDGVWSGNVHIFQLKLWNNNYDNCCLIDWIVNSYLYPDWREWLVLGGGCWGCWRPCWNGKG